MIGSLKKFAVAMRLHFPLPIMLFFLPCAWGLAMARYQAFSWAEILPRAILFGLGSVVMRSAGCLVNDILDRDIDVFVKRTANRPIATGEVKIWQALFLVLVLLCMGLAIISCFNKTTILICLIGGVVIFIYPLGKRFFSRPQMILGMAANFGILAGYASLANSVQLSTVILYTASIYWTMIYDTIYAYQDRREDIKLGVMSTAVLYGSGGKKQLYIFATMMCFLLFGAGLLDPVRMHWQYYIICSLATWLNFYIVKITDLEDPASCDQAFRLSVLVGLIVWGAIYSGRGI